MVVTILAIALDPFSQQLLQLDTGHYTESSLEDGTKPTAAYSRYYGEGVTLCKYGIEIDTELIYGSSMIDGEICTATAQIGMQAAIINGLSRPVQELHQERAVHCPAGNCTWPEFDTLGVCHKCTDVTDELERVDGFGSYFTTMVPVFEATGGIESTEFDDDDATAWKLPNGHYMTNIDGCGNDSLDGYQNFCWNTKKKLMAPRYRLTSFGTGQPNKTVTMQDLKTLIWSTSMIYEDEARKGSTKWPDTPMKATECAAYYCIKTIHVSTEDGVVRESSRENTSMILDPISWTPSEYFTWDDYQPEVIPEDRTIPTHWEFDPAYGLVTREFPMFRDKDDKSNYTVPGDAISRGNDPALRFTLGQWTIESISAFFQKTLKSDLPNMVNVSKAMTSKLGDDAVGFNGQIGWGIGDAGFAGYGALGSPRPEALAMLFSAGADSEWGRRGKGSDAALGDVGADGQDLISIGKGRSTMEEAYASLATSMTNEIRLYGNGTRMPLPINGTIHLQGPVYRATWPWISLHIIVLLIGILFCALTMVTTSDPRLHHGRHQKIPEAEEHELGLSSSTASLLPEKIPVLKAHSLAVLSHGRLMEGMLGDARTIEQLEAKAKDGFTTMRWDTSNHEERPGKGPGGSHIIEER